MIKLRKDQLLTSGFVKIFMNIGPITDFFKEK